MHLVVNHIIFTLNFVAYAVNCMVLHAYHFFSVKPMVDHGKPISPSHDEPMQSIMICGITKCKVKCSKHQAFKSLYNRFNVLCCGYAAHIINRQPGLSR